MCMIVGGGSTIWRFREGLKICSDSGQDQPSLLHGENYVRQKTTCRVGTTKVTARGLPEFPCHSSSGENTTCYTSRLVFNNITHDFHGIVIECHHLDSNSASPQHPIGNVTLSVLKGMCRYVLQ